MFCQFLAVDCVFVCIVFVIARIIYFVSVTGKYLNKIKRNLKFTRINKKLNVFMFKT